MMIGLGGFQMFERFAQFGVIFKRLADVVQLRTGMVNLTVYLLQSVKSQRCAHKLIIYEV